MCVLGFLRSKDDIHSWCREAIPLSECGLSRGDRFTFYDQVHTTGMDIKQHLNAIAIQTIGKDMSFRDLAQGAFRMRKIGQGQKIHLYVVPEVKRLIRDVYGGSGTLAVRASGWLQLNGLRLDTLQHLQLQSQNVRIDESIKHKIQRSQHNTHRYATWAPSGVEQSLGIVRNQY